MKRKIREIYDKLQENRNSLKIRSVVLALFLLGVNIFAWFVYFSKANVSLNASVVSWDVNFFDNNVQVNEIALASNMYPGMTPITKTVSIRNGSNMTAVISSEITDFSLLGNTSLLQGMDSSSQISYLKNTFPFAVDIVSSNGDLLANNSADYSITVSWPYETANKYYQINNLYLYDSSVDYYTFDGSNYNKDTTITSTNFNDKITSGIYLEKDDADSLIGQECGNYQKNNNLPCLTLKFKIIAIQKN